MLPNLSRLPSCSKCQSIGVTRQDLNPLLPGMSFKDGIREEDVIPPEDLSCRFCLNFLRFPFDGFSAEAGDDARIIEKQEKFDKLRSTSEIEAARSDFYRAGLQYSDTIRKSYPRRTQIEVLNPGCGHQFHRECLIKHVKTGAQKCVICRTAINPEILSGIVNPTTSQGVVRERSMASSIEQGNGVSYEAYISNVTMSVRTLKFILDPTRTEALRMTISELQERTRWQELHDSLIEWNPGILDALRRIDGEYTDIRTAMSYDESTLERFPTPNSFEYGEWEKFIGNCYFTYRLARNIFYGLPSSAYGRLDMRSVVVSLSILVSNLISPILQGGEADSYGWVTYRDLNGRQSARQDSMSNDIVLVKAVSQTLNADSNVQRANEMFDRLDLRDTVASASGFRQLAAYYDMLTFISLLWVSAVSQDTNEEDRERPESDVSNLNEYMQKYFQPLVEASASQHADMQYYIDDFVNLKTTLWPESTSTSPGRR